MGRDELKVGVRIRKFVIITARIGYRSVRNHPFIAGILLFLLLLYRSSPFLFSLLVSASPVLVCTAVLLGTLLSFGESTIVPSTEEEEKSCHEIKPLKTGSLQNTIVVKEDECFGRDSKYTELRREIVKTIDEDPLLDHTDRLDKSETDHDDAAFSSMPIDLVSREVRFEELCIDDANREVVNKDTENTEIEQTVNLGDEIRATVGISLSHGEAPQTRITSAILAQAEHFEDYKSALGSIDAQMSDLLVSSLESEKVLDEVSANSISLVQDVQHENYEDYKSAEGSVDAQVMDQSEPSLASWKHFDVLDDRLSLAQRVQDEGYEDYNLAEGSSESQLRDHLETSFTSWKQFSPDHDEDDVSESGSDGAESSSPDASMADIIPMLDELHPLLEDEILLDSNLSRQSSAAIMERSAKSPGSSIHSDNESYQEEEGDNDKSDADDDNEEEIQDGTEDSAKSAIMWTEDDQKNLMDLGTSELERNQRLQSLIARRRARKMIADRNLIDLDGMDLSFPVAPISTRKHNPFDYSHESYDDLGLPPIPGSAPSVLLPRRNPFDLPYDSSEEKPDLTGDSFQQEFMELTQREAFNQREAIFRRNETFSMGSSSGFDFGRPSRFRPYFVPERTDSDVMSYCSLQRQFSELSESKASSAAETESTSVGLDQDQKKLIEHDSVQEIEASSEIDHASVLVEHGSESSEDLNSLLGEENEKKDFVFSVPEVEMRGASSSPANACYTSETGESADNRLVYKEIAPEAESWRSRCEISHSDIQSMTELDEADHNISFSSLSEHKESNNVIDTCLKNREQYQVNNVLDVEIPVNYSSESSVFDVTTDKSLQVSNLSHANEIDGNHPKEPIYDLSPLKMNLSCSSSSSDLQRETSGIDLYHLSRDLFVAEESDIHYEAAKNISGNTKQGADENSLSTNDIGECGFGGTESFPELNQVPENSQALAVAEDGSHLSTDSSDEGIDDKLADDKVSPHVLEKLFARDDGAEIHLENRLVFNSSLNDMPSADTHEFLEDSVLAEEKKEATVFAENDFSANSIVSCSEVLFQKEIGIETEVNQKLQVSSPSSKSHDNDGTENLIFSLDETHFLPHDSDMLDNLVDTAEKEPSIIHRKLEQIDHSNEVDEPVKVLMAQEPQHNELSDSCQSNESSSQLEESETKSIAQLATKVPVQDTAEENHDVFEGFEASVAFEQIVDDDRSAVKDMDEALLSELDVVGDFSVSDVVPNLKNSMINLKAAVDANISAEVIGEVSSCTEMPFVHEMLLEDSTHVEKSESERNITLDNLAETNESDIESHTGDVNTDLLDAAFKEVSEVVQKSVIAESVVAGFSRKEMEVPVPKNELLLEDNKPGSCASEVLTLAADTSFISSSVQEEIQSDLVLPSIAENQDNLDSDLSNIDSGIQALDADIMNESGEDVEQTVEAEVDKSDIAQTATEIDAGSVESMPLQVDSDFKEIFVSPFVKESTTQDLEPRHQAESIDNIEFETEQMDRDMKEILQASSLEESNAPALVSDYGHQALKVPVLGPYIAPTDESENKRETKTSEPFLSEQMSAEIPVSPIIGACVESATITESEKINTEVNETQEFPAHEGSTDPACLSEDHQGGEVESSEPRQLDMDIHELQESSVVEKASNPSVLQSDEEEKIVGLLESDRLPRHRVVEGLQEWHVVDRSMSLAVESGNIIERPAPIESEPVQMDMDITEIQKFPPALASIAAVLESEDQILTRNAGESGMILTERNIGELQELCSVEGEEALAIESEGQVESVCSVASEPLQMDGEFKEIQVSRDLQISYPSAVECKDQMYMTSQMEVVGVQVLQDHQSLPQEQWEGDVPNAEAASEFHSDSSTTAQLTNAELKNQGTSNSSAENFTSQVEEEKSHQPPLNSSSNSSNDQMNITSQLDVARVQDLQDHQLDSQRQWEVDVPNLDEASEFGGDSSATAQLSNIKLEDEDTSKRAAENYIKTSQVEEEKLH